MTTLRRLVRLVMMVMLLFGGLFTVLVLFPVMSASRNDRTMAGWSRWLLRACGLRLKVPPEASSLLTMEPGQGRLLVANHVSWIDIFVINAVAPSCFIAKDDIARWPLIGTLVGRVGTLFLARGKRHAVHSAIKTVSEFLRQGKRIAVFPEGTSGSGEMLQPFHGNLIEAAVQAGVPVAPVALRYRGLRGESLSGPDGAMNFVDEDITFLKSVWRIIGAPGVWAELYPLPLLAVPEVTNNRSRHELATRARVMIGECLNVPLDDSTPETVKQLRTRA